MSVALAAPKVPVSLLVQPNVLQYVATEPSCVNAWGNTEGRSHQHPAWAPGSRERGSCCERPPLWELPRYTWPSGCTLAFLFSFALGWACSLSVPFVLTRGTTGCESSFLAGRAGQDELAALGSAAGFIVVPWDPTVGTFWEERKALLQEHKHACTHTV